MTKLSRDIILTDITDYLIKDLGLNESDDEIKDGFYKISESFLNLFSKNNIEPLTATGAEILLWMIYSAVLEGQEDQKNIDAFFSSVNLNILNLYHTWLSFKPEEQMSQYTVAIVPGRLDDADIAAVTAALFKNQFQKNKQD
jgi:hypothetical protein